MSTIIYRLSKLLNSLLVAALLILLAGCETELSEEPIGLIGDPPEDWYVGSEFRYTFGIKGGTGVYQIRYLKTPPEGSGFENDASENDVDMTIFREDSAKREFTLVGQPTLPAGRTINSLSNESLTYFIEVTDGKQTKVFKFDAALLANELVLPDDLQLNESDAGDLRDLNTLLDRARLIEANDLVDQVVCHSVRTNPVETERLVNGEIVKFFYKRVSLAAPTASDLEVFYRLRSRYTENQSDLFQGNVGSARPGGDFLDVEDSLIFKRNEEDCAIKIGLYDDTLLEGDEDLEVEFFSRSGELLSLDNNLIRVEITDNEPSVSYIPDQTLVNRGEAAAFEYVANVANGGDTTVLIGTNALETTASDSQFSLIPQTGFLEFDPDTPTASISVLASQYALSAELGGDPRVVLTSSADLVEDIDGLNEVVINEWATLDNNAGEIVGREIDGEVIVDATSSDNGLIYVIEEGLASTGESIARIKGYYRNGFAVDIVDGSQTIVLEKLGVNVRPVAIASSGQSNIPQVAVLLEVDGMFATSEYGGTDFVVAIFSINSEKLELLAVEQFGSELDDDPAGLRFNQNGQLIVFGSTQGLTLNNGPGSTINSGGRDGFIFLLQGVGSSINLRWFRFVGDTPDESLFGADIGRTDIIALLSEDSASTKANLFGIGVSSGEDLTDFDSNVINSGFGSRFAGVFYDENLSDFYTVGSSRATFPDGGLTENGSEDIFVLRYNSQGGLAGTVEFGSPGLDRVTSLAVLKGRDQLALAGTTSASLEGQASRGGQDVYFASITLDDAFELDTITQFGTPGTDTVINIEAVSSDKYFVLWSEDFSSGDGTLTYRISVISPKGRKMSPDPS